MQSSLAILSLAAAIALTAALAFETGRRRGRAGSPQAGDLGALADSLARSERYAKAIIDNSLDLISVVEPDGTIRLESASVTRMLGYAPGENVGKNAFSFIHRDDLPAAIANFKKGMADPSATPSTVYRFRHKDGSWRWLESVGRNLLHDEAIKGVLVNSRDVTERLAAEGRSRELDLLKNKFIEIVGGQMRGPVTAVRWNLERMLDGELGTLVEPQRSVVLMSYEANGELVRRIHDIVTALDIAEGKAALAKSLLSFDELMSAAMSDWRRRCEVKGIVCVYEPPPVGLPAIEGDREKLLIAIEKLIDNAILYTGKGGRNHLRAYDMGGSIRFEVMDTGIGIPEKEQSRIFERFFRASNAASLRAEASGLGLAIAKHYVERHGGTIGFASREGKGSTFWFDLPTAPAVRASKKAG